MQFLRINGYRIKSRLIHTADSRCRDQHLSQFFYRRRDSDVYFYSFSLG